MRRGPSRGPPRCWPSPWARPIRCSASGTFLSVFFAATILPKLFGSSEFTTRTLRFAWHITTVAWFGFAALLVHAGRGDLTVSGMLQIVGLTFGVSGCLPLLLTRGKHLSWLVLFVIGGVAFWCAA